MKILLGEAIHREIEQIAEVAGTPMTDQYRIAILLGLQQMRMKRELSERRKLS